MSIIIISVSCNIHKSNQVKALIFDFDSFFVHYFKSKICLAAGKVLMSNIEKQIQNRLFEMQDLKYMEFQRKIITTVNPDTIIGVRTPQLRKYANEISKTPQVQEYLKILPHKYFEENNLHGFIIETFKDYDEAIEAIENFLPYIDNWATCDSISPKIFKKHLSELYEKIKEWMKSDRTYTIRFGIKMLMSCFLDDKFKPEMLELAAEIKSDEYYVNMMTAWYFATALAKQYDAALPYLLEKRLDKWTHNKAIQKAVESYRINDDKKAYLKTLKIK